ncbi:Major Facilitator Superfamily protein [Pseudohyphozyma bogoriensis]|nr:Major Facilitator Superfamily protein [Pseudohyphozyma bogoriensis]
MSDKSTLASPRAAEAPLPAPKPGNGKRSWYRSTYFAAIVLGLCNFAAPGIWGAMNSLGAGGEETPWLVNAANAETFSLMVLTAFLTSALTNKIGVKWSLFVGAAGYAPFAAGLYCNNRFGNTWFVILGAALCGISAGIFWAIEAAVALSYPEPENQGKFLGLWLSFRVLGPILGGAINLGLNAKNNQAGAVNPKVYLVFIALQALGPFIAFLLPSPSRVQRTDGLAVRLFVNTGTVHEIKETAKLFFSKKFLLIVPFIVQAVFPEAFSYTYIALYFSVRARALGSFLGALVAIICGNILGTFLDRHNIPLKTRARGAFAAVVITNGAWWIWSSYIQSLYQDSGILLDWSDPNFGRGFAGGGQLYVALAVGFQVNYLYAYFLVTEPADIIRIAGLLRATESAAQAVAYGLDSVSSFGTIGVSALNFGLWGFAIVPAWFVVKEVGVTYFGRGEFEAKAVRGGQEEGKRGAGGSSSESKESLEV